ncbi:hypothetical protein M405DRAFT_838665 [Rhizopogon salebrosus TDB-379]|nr:hypothetical protein M405DRAFT_838665 [Rhizopogon salebrosus TDB-379]
MPGNRLHIPAGVRQRVTMSAHMSPKAIAQVTQRATALSTEFFGSHVSQALWFPWKAVVPVYLQQQMFRAHSTCEILSTVTSGNKENRQQHARPSSLSPNALSPCNRRFASEFFAEINLTGSREDRKRIRDLQRSPVLRRRLGLHQGPLILLSKGQRAFTALLSW